MKHEGVGAQVSSELIKLVERVRGCSNYYDILAVSRTCSDEDIGKAYTKVDGRVCFLCSDDRSQEVTGVRR